MSRSLGAKVVDRALSKAFGLPAATSGYSVVRNVPVPMRDGVTLLADHYVPSGKPRGTLLVRSPYGRAGAFGLVYARPYAERGFHVVVQSGRGTFGSGGDINAFYGEVEDGADTVAWLREQDWFTGSFATLGVSYLGITQWAILMDPPPEMVAALIISAPHDSARLLYPGGAFALQSAAGWTDLMLHQEDHGVVVGTIAGLVNGDKRIAPVLNELSLKDGAHKAYGDRAPWHDVWLEQTDITAAYWESGILDAALERCNVPVLLYSGWQDMMLEQVLEQYDALAARDVDVQLVVGPWNHTDMLLKAGGLIARDSLAWFAEHLAGDGKRLELSPVRIFVTGAEEWREPVLWPVPTTPETLYLQPGGGLGAEAVSGTASTFTYDPTDPTPKVGGLTNARTAGRRDNTALEARGDVLTFTGPVLTRDLEVIGAPLVELAHTSDNPHCDLFVRLCEVDAKGRSWNLAERFVRLTSATEVVTLELSSIAHRFTAGTRLRLQVSGGTHPQHDRNLGTGEPPATGRTTRPSTRTIAHGPSKLVLPVPS
ncbi:MAG: hydrolase CocE/NonD family protein [Frankiales bacterium]|nr:hydrolase CocE/NonD family protein [Frankiales bacterium]